MKTLFVALILPLLTLGFAANAQAGHDGVSPAGEAALAGTFGCLTGAGAGEVVMLAVRKGDPSLEDLRNGAIGGCIVLGATFGTGAYNSAKAEEAPVQQELNASDNNNSEE
ncbi:MAG: hypothetical protein ACXWQO_02180 [Bdellovibrionota bacterium]